MSPRPRLDPFELSPSCRLEVALLLLAEETLASPGWFLTERARTEGLTLAPAILAAELETFAFGVAWSKEGARVFRFEKTLATSPEGSSAAPSSVPFRFEVAVLRRKREVRAWADTERDFEERKEGARTDVAASLAIWGCLVG